jgi:hypothetical protein
MSSESLSRPSSSSVTPSLPMATHRSSSSSSSSSSYSSSSSSPYSSRSSLSSSPSRQTAYHQSQSLSVTSPIRKHLHSNTSSPLRKNFSKMSTSPLNAPTFYTVPINPQLLTDIEIHSRNVQAQFDILYQRLSKALSEVRDVSFIIARFYSEPTHF